MVHEYSAYLEAYHTKLTERLLLGIDNHDGVDTVVV